MEVLKTKFQQEREQRDLEIYTEYERMMSVEGQSITEVCKELMRKFNIHSMSSIYLIRKRVERKLQTEHER